MIGRANIAGGKASRRLQEDRALTERPAEEGDARSPLVGMVKPTKLGIMSYGDLLAMLPPDIRTSVRYAPIVHGAMEEFAGAIPAYSGLVAELAAEGADLIHVEGTPPFLILGYAGERKLVERWEKDFRTPIFTSAQCQVNALHALGVRRLVDAGYDPTTGPQAERYFRDAGFDVLAVEKIPVDWGTAGYIDDEEVFAMLASLVRRHPGADGLCLQGSSKFRLSGVIARLEEELGVAVVHPLAARYWELMARLGRIGAKPGLGRLLATMPRHPLVRSAHADRLTLGNCPSEG
jgi:maleate cis-trans isomerase